MTATPDLLIVDDDAAWCRTAANAFSRRGFSVHVAVSLAQARAVLSDQGAPDYALIDLRIGHESGLILVEEIAAAPMHTRIVVLTGYASIATAVEAVKLGAHQYLAKPARVADILVAFEQDGTGDASAAIAEQPPSVRRLEWEHIQQVLRQHNGNISATARALGMHRRTLQRKLHKHPVRH